MNGLFGGDADEKDECMNTETEIIISQLGRAEQFIKWNRSQDPAPVRKPYEMHVFEEAENIGWNHVSTMPPEGVFVLVYCEAARCVGLAYVDSNGEWNMPEPQALGYYSITHWREMPKPPNP